MYQSGRPVEVLEQQRTVRWCKRIVQEYCTYYHDLRVLNPCPIPSRGPGILVCNHTSSLDPMLLQAACPRLITWMMAQEYGSVMGLQWFFRAIEPILVERSGRDLTATREALRALEEGKVLGIFPEGHIETSREFLEFQTGVAMLAVKSGAPVYPAFIEGTQRCKGMLEVFFRPNGCTIAFGAPLVFERTRGGRTHLETIIDQIKSAIAAAGRLNDR